MDNVLKCGDIKTGDLIAWARTKGFYNTVIRFFTMSDYTHVGIVVVEDDEYYVVEAVSPTVAKNRLDSNVPFYHIPMGVEVDKESLEYLHSLIGSKYSKLQAFLSWFNIYISDDKWYCTELSYEFYTRIGLKFDKKLTPTKFIKQAVQNYQKKMIYIESLT